MTQNGDHRFQQRRMILSYTLQQISEITPDEDPVNSLDTCTSTNG
jgi:hypothetical protein